MVRQSTVTRKRGCRERHTCGKEKQGKIGGSFMDECKVWWVEGTVKTSEEIESSLIIEKNR